MGAELEAALCELCEAVPLLQEINPVSDQRKTQTQYGQLSTSQIISASVMSSALNTNCLVLALLPIRTILTSYLPFVLSCALSNNFLSAHFFTYELDICLPP